MMKLYKKLKLFLYSFVIRKLLISKILKINILTIHLINKTGMVKVLGATAGGLAGGAIKPQLSFILVPIGTIIGGYIGGLIDKQLYEINQQIEILDENNDQYIKNHDNQIIKTKLHDYIIKIIEDITDIIKKNNSSKNQNEILNLINAKINSKYLYNKYNIETNQQLQNQLINLIKIL